MSQTVRLLVRRRPQWSPATTVVVGVVSLTLAVALVASAVDTTDLAAAVRAMADDPWRVAVALAAFALAFIVRAAVWRRVLPALPFGQAIAALHVSLGANHVLPLRLGEPLRVVSVVRRAGTPIADATASTMTLRAADLIAMLAIAAVLAPSVVLEVLGAWVWPTAAGVVAVAAAGIMWLRRLPDAPRFPGPTVAIGTTAAWVAESVLVWQAATFAGIDLPFGHAVLVTTTAVAAQLVAIAPSGVGTYEAASVAAYSALGVDPGTALVAAISAHALKTAYSLVTGAVAVAVPAPGFFGRFRLATRPDVVAAGDRRGAEPEATEPEATEPGADEPASGGRPPVVLFLPAHDEAASVVQVLRRCPSHVAGHPVRRLVVDDGSGDATASLARRAGAEVLSFESNRGLGAAVRAGLSWATEQGCAAVAFCDADGEYAPEELERLVTPILAGEADYVVGSRFAGRIERMHLHRRLGNLVLTRLLRMSARTPITDGQSGYRAFSPAAAADAEVIHDFNYAQVLTLDLLAKGYRYAETPISYSFRTTGDSFIRLGRYLRAVGPAVWRELNAPGTARPSAALASSPASD